MTAKLILLKTGENIISNLKEGFLGDNLICYILENPCKIICNGSYDHGIVNEENSDFKISVSLHPWPSLSKDTVVEINPDSIMTIVDPIDNLKEMYGRVLGDSNETYQNFSTNEFSNSNQPN